MKRKTALAAAAAATVVLACGGTAVALTSGDGAGATTSTASAPQIRAMDDDRDDDRDEDRENDREDDSADDRDDADDAGARTSRDSVLITAVQAIDAAVRAQPGTVVQVELEDDDERDWEVTVHTGSRSSTVHVDSTTGRVLGTDKDDAEDAEDADDDRDASALLRGATTSAREAAELASAKGFVTSVDLDAEGEHDDRTPGWDVTVRDARGAETDWDVELKGGEVSADRDDDGDRDS
ncbi:PepSY domain-containing protein [Streptomyces sp. NPDC007818]|uniref:PepSY domain-containing protein n=1 Tax=Streptomyces sp. NPDC007818 TaxID=3364780 RepID=UPI0036B0655C